MTSEVYTKKRKHDEEQGTIIFTIARMNPPTSGHMKVIHTLIQTALTLNQDKVYILLSKKTGTQRNPLFCNEKRDLLLNGMIENVQKSYDTHVDVEIICDDDRIDGCGDKYIVKELCHIMKSFDKGVTINLHLIIGQDREFEFSWIKNVLNKPDNPATLRVIPVPRPDGAISATDIRNFAMNGQHTEFIEKEMEAGLSEIEAEKLYLKLNSRLPSLPIKSPKAKSASAIASAKTAKTAKSIKIGGKKRRKTKRYNKIKIKKKGISL